MNMVIKDKILEEKRYRALAVYGSPRRGGNTDVLADTFLEGLKNCSLFNYTDNKSGNKILKLEIEKIYVSALSISSCRECRNCSKNGECIIDDEMQDIYPKMIGCDLLLIASPVFFTTVSGYLKTFIDRFQRFWALKYELDKKIVTMESKKGILFSCAGSKPENIFDCTRKVMRALFDVLNIKYYADFCYKNIDFKGDILKKPEILDYVYKFGKKGEFILGG